MNIKSIIPITTFEIRFSYITKRGNQKENSAIIKNLSEELAAETFKLAMIEHNQNCKHRPYSNVEILEVKVIDIDSITV